MKVKQGVFSLFDLAHPINFISLPQYYCSCLRAAVRARCKELDERRRKKFESFNRFDPLKVAIKL